MARDDCTDSMKDVRQLKSATIISLELADHGFQIVVESVGSCGGIAKWGRRVLQRVHGQGRYGAQSLELSTNGGGQACQDERRRRNDRNVAIKALI